LSDPEHPWELTLPELLRRVVELCGEEQGRRAAETIRRYAEIVKQPDDEILEPETIATFLEAAGLPPDLLQLDS
jgi:hypothetical protein